MEFSKYQEALFDFGTHGVGNAIVKAVAGSGKTTTLVELIKRLAGSSIFLAFNKPIATELAARGVNGRTFHSVGASAINRARLGKLDVDKMWKLINEFFTEEDQQMYGSFCKKLVGFAKQIGMHAMVEESPEVWNEIIDHQGMTLDHDRANYQRGIDLASRLLRASNEANTFDFDDMIYWPVLKGLTMEKFDNVLVDELQDTNAIQIELIRKMMHSTSRFFGVGDPSQAIYGFRGADSDSMQKVAHAFNAKEFPLSISYRCGKSIVNEARAFCSHIEASPNAQDGLVRDSNIDPLHFDPTDLVVCRTTAPLVKLAFQTLKAGVSCRIMGQDIGKGLKNLIKKMDVNTIDELRVAIQTWSDRESSMARVKKQDSKAQAIEDQASAVIFFCDNLKETARTIQGLYNSIDALFTDQNHRVTFATIHRAKGLEANRVWWLNSSKQPSKWAKKDWEIQQEVNLQYVAATRAKSELVYIEI